MKFEFDRTKMWWDSYHRFHQCLEYASVFTVFESGEAIVTRRFDNMPEHRTLYKKYHVQIVGTNDTNCPLFDDPEGQPVAKAWLDDNGQQILLVDHDHGVAVRLGERGGLDVSMCHDWQKVVPESLRSSAYAYWPGPNSPPVGAPVTLNQARRLTSEERAHVEALKAECRGWETMSEQPERVGHWSQPKHMGHWIVGESERKPLPLEMVMSAKTYLELAIDERLDLSRHGCDNGLVHRVVPYVKLRGWTKDDSI